SRLLPSEVDDAAYPADRIVLTCTERWNCHAPTNADPDRPTVGDGSSASPAIPGRLRTSPRCPGGRRRRHRRPAGGSPRGGSPAGGFKEWLTSALTGRLGAAGGTALAGLLILFFSNYWDRTVEAFQSGIMHISPEWRYWAVLGLTAAAGALGGLCNAFFASGS